MLFRVIFELPHGSCCFVDEAQSGPKSGSLLDPVLILR